MIAKCFLNVMCVESYHILGCDNISRIRIVLTKLNIRIVLTKDLYSKLLIKKATKTDTYILDSTPLNFRKIKKLKYAKKTLQKNVTDGQTPL
jgi:hypothetical protein